MMGPQGTAAGSSSSHLPSFCGTVPPLNWCSVGTSMLLPFNTSAPGTFAVQVVPGSDQVRVVWLHPQDP